MVVETTPTEKTWTIENGLIGRRIDVVVRAARVFMVVRSHGGGEMHTNISGGEAISELVEALLEARAEWMDILAEAGAKD